MSPRAGRRPAWGPSATGPAADGPGPPGSATDVRLLGPALVAWAAVAATLDVGVAGHAWAAGGAVAVAVALGPVLRRGRGRAAGAAAYLALVLAALGLTQTAVAGHLLLREAGDLNELTAHRAAVRLVVVVTGDPVARSAADRDTRQVIVRARAVEVTGRGRTTGAHAAVLLVGDERLLPLRWHERVDLRVRLAPALPGREELAVAHLSADPVPLADPGIVARGAERLRAGLRAAVDGTPPDARGLLPGLVIGDTSRTPPDLTDAMLATGMTHLSAVSGANVAVVLGLVLGAAALVGLPRALRPVVALLALAGFVVLARPEPSVVRAAVMGGIGLIGLSRSRAAVGPPVLAAAVCVLLVDDPWLARSYGFVLSTLATVGLLLFTRPWGRAIARVLPRRLRGLGPALAVPLAAQVMCAPVIVLLQGSVSVVGVLANVLVAPLVPAATVIGVTAAVADLVSARLGALLGAAGAVPTLGIARVARTFADVPGGTLPWPDGPAGAVLLAVLSGAGLLLGPALGRRAARHPVAVLALGALLVAATVPTAPLSWPAPDWRMVVCDVGQGDAIVLRSGAHRAVLVDAGPDPRLVDRCLRRLDVDTLDAVVLSHFHADHVEGLPGALDGRRVGRLLTSPVADPAFEAEQVVREAAQRGIPERSLALGEVLRAGELTATVLGPGRRIEAGSVPNNGSVVLLVSTGGVDALLLGDIEREAAHDLLLRLRRDPALAESVQHLDVVKVAHHGSANLDPELVAAVEAPAAVISVGADNDYGHPAPSTLALLRADGYAVYRTDRQGDLAVVDTDRGVVIAPARR